MTLVNNQDVEYLKFRAYVTDNSSFSKYFQKYGDTCESIVELDKVTDSSKRFRCIC